MRAGALGLSTSRTPNHQTSDDKPVPSRQADWSEVRAFVNTMGSLGAGLFEIANEQNGEPALRRAYYERLRDLAVESGDPSRSSSAGPLVTGKLRLHRSLRGSGGSRRPDLRSRA